ncbi:MAG: TIM-barrel domain-containing protein, partial [Sulfolobales archaeon]
MSEVKRSSHDLKIRVETGLKSSRILINDPDPVIKFGLPDGEPRPSVRINGNSIEISYREYKRSVEIKHSGDKLIISTSLRPWEHILGLGEKTLPLDRRRVRVAMWNYDNFGYQRGVDPLYISIPFMIIVSRGFSFGIFVNHPGYSVFDIGYSEYDKILIEVWDTSTEVFAIVGSSPKEVLEIYTSITGKPFIPPRWALGHQVSRYSYYPQSLVLEIIDKILEYAPLDVIYLDIDYMDKFRIFTWDKERFPDPRKFSDELHKRGVKLVTIIDPYIKIDPEDGVFREALDLLVRRRSGEIYVSKGWPGYSGIPDFFNRETREWWASKIEWWAREYGVDGVWLDMNEP